MNQTELNNHPLYLAGIPAEMVGKMEDMWPEFSRAIPSASKNSYYTALIAAVKNETALRLAPDPVAEAMKAELRRRANVAPGYNCTDNFMRQYANYA